MLLIEVEKRSKSMQSRVKRLTCGRRGMNECTYCMYVCVRKRFLEKYRLPSCSGKEKKNKNLAARIGISMEEVQYFSARHKHKKCTVQYIKPREQY